MAKCMQCGGPTKMKKMAKGGSAEIVGMPKYGNNPRTSTGAMLKKGGSVKKYQDGGPVAAMQKAMGQKPVSTKKTMKYVRKKGSGYIPPTESNKPDTSKWAEKQASPNAKKMQKGGTNSVVIRKAKSTDPYPMTLEGLEMKKKGLEMKHNGMQMKLKGEAMKKMPEKIVQTNKMAKGGSVAKAKFGASVPVQHSPAPGRVRSASGVGTVSIGKRKMGGVTKKLVKAQKGTVIKTPKTYNQQLMQKFPKMAASDTLPENSVARTQFYAPSAYNASKAKVDRENEYNDSEGESRVRSKAELAAMKKKLSVYKQKGGAMKKYAKGGFPDLNKDGKITKADILKGRGVIKRKGGAIKKK
jgi:hypothetical protein